LKNQGILIKLIAVACLFLWGCEGYIYQASMEAYFTRASDPEQPEAVREAAARDLIAQGRPAAEFLVGKLLSGTASEGHTAAALLGSMGGDAVEPLCRVLPLLRGGKLSSAIEALGETGGRDLFGWIEPYVSNKDWRIRLRAYQALRRLPVKEKDRIFKEAVMDSCPFIRSEAVDFFRTLRPEGGGEMLVPLLKDDSYIVRFQAASALAAFTHESSFSPEESIRPGSENEKLALIEVFKKIPRERAVPNLMLFLADESWSVRGYAALALGAMGEAAFIPVLEERLTREHHVFTRDRIEEALRLCYKTPEQEER